MGLGRLTMRIVITGASGFVGQQLVPRLLERGVALLLVGRHPEALRSRFPSCDIGDYDSIATKGTGYDLLLHLAVLNNDQNGEWSEFERANVKVAVDTCLKARDAGVRIFAFVSTILAVNDSDKSFYATSKRLAEARLADVTEIAKTIIYLPAVAGETFAGKLAILNRLPRALRGVALRMLGALRPTVQIEHIVEAVVALARADGPSIPKSAIISDGQRDNLFFRAGKRLFDITFAVSVILLFWWAMAIIWVLVRVRSEGPGIFRQIRIGKGEREFVCYKFRTMLVSTPNVGTHHASAAAVTPVGRFLRKTKLDELPQVFNILANQMSLVGPRPCLPNQVELIAARRARGVNDAIPGITGLAQCNGIDMSDPDLLAMWDERYIRLQSLLLDIKIVIRTFLGGGAGDRIRPVEPEIADEPSA